MATLLHVVYERPHIVLEQEFDSGSGASRSLSYTIIRGRKERAFEMDYKNNWV